MRGSGRAAAALVLGLLLVPGCGPADSETAAPEATPAATPAPTPAADAEPTGPVGAAAEPALRAELVQMLEDDQAERAGDAAVWNDRERAERLAEIAGEHGWPTYSLVGADGATAAWAIAQHADHDVAFQEEMLELMAVAVADGEADASQLAFLTDRVAMNQGRPQVYGSQMGCVDGEAVPGPIEDEANVDARRAEMGLEPLADYLAQFDEVCTAEN